MKPNDKAYQEAADEIRFNSGLDLSEYAGLIEELREDALQFDLKDTAYENTAKEAADAIEALLAERDALRKWKEDDSDAMRIFARYRELEAERDALAARLAPVDDEALVEIVGRTLRAEVFDPDVLKVYGDLWAYDEQRKILKQARAAIAAIRPHIEAAEMERCAKIADKYEGEWHSDTADACARAIAAAIRRGE